MHRLNGRNRLGLWDVRPCRRGSAAAIPGKGGRHTNLEGGNHGECHSWRTNDVVMAI
jgi:hypothetical protein